jgi:two-component system chemotaxis sensor kinase CheA
VDKSKLMQRLMGTFVEELDEHVRTLNQDLMALEKGVPAPEQAQRLQSLFRTAHSLKGAARSVGLALIEGACHRLEEFLTTVRDGGRSLEREAFKILFATADALEEAGMRLREKNDLAGSRLEGLLPQLETLAAGGPTAVESKALEASADPVPLPAQAAMPSPPQEAPIATSTSVRVSADKLDSLLARLGELAIARWRLDARRVGVTQVRDFVEQWKTQWQRVAADSRQLKPAATQARNGAAPCPLSARALRLLDQSADHLRRLATDLDHLADGMSADGRLLDQVVGPLNDEVRSVRMLPFAQACEGLDRMARDLAQSRDKEVDVLIEGGEVELDRSVLEGLKDPLRHLVRNAVDHGIEPVPSRRAAGKAPHGRVTVAASLRGAQVEVIVEDDGAGLDLESLREQARQRGLTVLDNASDLARLIFLPGLSTASIITDISGRGVGLDVVKSRLEALHGTVEVSSQTHEGTRFTLTVPLTLTTLRALLFKAGKQTYAFAGTNVIQLLRILPSECRPVVGRPMLAFGGQLMPLVCLESVFRPDAVAHHDGLAGGKSQDTSGKKIPVVVVAAGEQRMALAVDEFVGEQEIVIKSLGSRLRHLRYVAGATLLPSGQIALVLNAANVIRSALEQPGSPGSAGAPVAVSEQAKKRLLLAEDSLTTRTLMKSILEAAGYEVFAAADGEAAWQTLQEKPVDGFALTARVRESRTWRDLPVVLVTSRESDADKRRGIEAGANAYLVKSAFDQRQLLQTLGQLL